MFTPSNLVDVQINSYKWFLEKGLRELFDEISPIKDHTGKELELSFLDYKFDQPKYSEAKSLEKDQTYEAPLRVNVKLLSKDTKQSKVQEVYLGDFLALTQQDYIIDQDGDLRIRRGDEAGHRSGLVARGKMSDAMLVEIRDDLLFYSYGVRGVEYTASQDVSMLKQYMPLDFSTIDAVSVNTTPRTRPIPSCWRNNGAGCGLVEWYERG